MNTPAARVEAHRLVFRAACVATRIHYAALLNLHYGMLQQLHGADAVLEYYERHGEEMELALALQQDDARRMAAENN